MTLNLRWLNRSYICFIRWCECNYSCLWIDCICSNFFSFRSFCRNCCFICWLSIYDEFRWYIFINWRIFTSRFEVWFTVLSFTLNSCCNIIKSFWYYRYNNWCILGCSWSSICIHTFYSYSFSCSCKLVFRYKCYRSIFCYCVDSFSWNFFSSCSIFKCCRYFIIDWEFRISLSKCYRSCLCFTLVSSCCFILTFWFYWSNRWSISCFNFCSIFICRYYFRWFWCSSEVFIRLECNHSCSWIDCVSTNCFSIFCSWKSRYFCTCWIY